MTIDERPIGVKRLNRTFHERGERGPQCQMRLIR